MTVRRSGAAGLVGAAGVVGVAGAAGVVGVAAAVLVAPHAGGQAGARDGVQAGARTGVQAGIQAGIPAGAQTSVQSARRETFTSPSAGIQASVQAGAQAGVQAGARAGGTPAARVTYAADIAPMLDAHCVVCHRPGAIGPFSLASYDAARGRAAQIAEAAAARRMPPWKPVGAAGRFSNERRLTDDQIARLAAWAEAGAPAGDPARRPPAPVFDGDWALGAPDLIVPLPVPYPLAPGDGDVYRNFALPVALDGRRWVRAVALRPGAGGRRAIHHARILLDAAGRARALDAADGAPGYDGVMLDHARFPDGHFLGWAPGRTPVPAPDAIAWPLDPGTDLVLQLHLLRGAAAIAVQPAVGLYFADRPATATAVSVLLTSKAIRIPAGAAAHVVEDGYRLPIAVDLLGLSPHMHRLGRRVDAHAALPDGRDLPLLRIDDWDFDWQDEYRFREPVRLPAGTRIAVRFTFDNSAANPENPHDPPVTIGFGPGADDEMAELLLQVVPAGDPAPLLRSLAVKRVRDDILGYQTLLRADPDDHVNHAALAARYLDVGDAAAARTHLDLAIALAPDFADAHYVLGSAHLADGDHARAIAAYRRAIALRPDYPEAHNNLGGVLAATGAADAAAAAWRQALRFDPDHAGARYNLATLLLGRGEAEAAIRHYRRALAATPDDPDVLTGLARALVAGGGAGAAAEAAALDARARRLGAGW